MRTPKTAKIYVRVNAVLRGRLVELAGEYGNVSQVVRVILERHFQKKGTR
jgi:hypothetical protein